MDLISIKIKPENIKGVKTATILLEGELSPNSIHKIKSLFLTDVIYYDKYIIDCNKIENFDYLFVDVFVALNKIARNIGKVITFNFNLSSSSYHTILETTNFYNYNIQN